MPGPLAGVRIVEIAGIGPGPFACMMLADHGAEVIRVERPADPTVSIHPDPRNDIHLRSRADIIIADLKTAEGVARVRELAASADGLVEGFRPGVMERLGLGPDALLAANPKLVYGRMTGWGQSGPLAQVPGHDINYIAISGTLHAFGRDGEKPTPPINMLGDYGGGGLMLAFGMVSALLAVRGGAPGQVVDCAMTEGAALLMSLLDTMRAEGIWSDRRGTNLLDTGAPFYEVYETADRRFVAVGALETPYYRELLDRIGLTNDPDFRWQMDSGRWPRMKARLETLFKTRTRAEWCALAGDNCCFSPVLDREEALSHPHNVARGTFLSLDGLTQPAPAPRYSATPNDCPRPRKR